MHNGGGSGFANPPGDWVLRAADLAGQIYVPGQIILININAFQPNALGWLSEAFARAPLWELRSITEIEPLVFSLECTTACRTVRVEFRSPTELKTEGRIATEPDFSTLFARVCGRIVKLHQLYSRNEIPGDIPGLTARASAIRTEASSLRYMTIQRRSSRTGQVHGIGGWVGDVTYAGDLTAFLPWLTVAQWTGVGRHTVWGNGEIHVTPL